MNCLAAILTSGFTMDQGCKRGLGLRARYFSDYNPPAPVAGELADQKQVQSPFFEVETRCPSASVVSSANLPKKFSFA